MSKIADYLQEHLVGEVTDSLEVRRYFSHDASILQMTPSIVVYAASENDVRKLAHFCWQLAKRGKRLPITARGGGTDTSGAAIGSGVMVVFTAHLNSILALDPKKESVTVEPGITFGSLQQTLMTHGLFLPPYPAAATHATVGGSLANNAIGEKSVKYGDMRQHVEHLSAVLANGEVIETGPLNKRELNKKLGLTGLEGDIYRGIDALIEENRELLEREQKQITATHNRVGYNIFDVKQKGSFDLTPLFLGSQGSLGLITEAVLRLARHNPATGVAVVSLTDLDGLHDILPRIIDLKPSVCEMINHAAISQITRINPNLLSGVLDHPADAVHLVVEFDDAKDNARKKSLKALGKLAERAGGHLQLARSDEERDRIEKLRRSLAILFWESRGGAQAVPVAEDLSLPTDRLSDFLQRATDIFTAMELPPVMWGHAGDGVVRLAPTLDLAQLGDRQKLLKLTDALYKIAASMGGSTTAAAGDGRVRAPYMGHVYGPEMHKVMFQIKKIFDPYGLLNPGVKTATAEQVKSLIRTEYSHAHYDHLPLN